MDGHQLGRHEGAGHVVAGYGEGRGRGRGLCGEGEEGGSDEDVCAVFGGVPDVVGGGAEAGFGGRGEEVAERVGEELAGEL